MTWVSGTAVFVVIWWTVIFAVLPWGVTRDATTGQIGAPTQPQMLKKVIITTIISIIIWLAINYVVSSPYLSFREMAAEAQL